MRQTPQQLTRTLTWPGPGVGTSREIRRSGPSSIGAGWSTTQASTTPSCPRIGDGAAPGLPPGGNLTQTGRCGKRMHSFGAARHIRTAHSGHDFGGCGDFGLLARHRLYGSKTTTATGTTHHEETDARCKPYVAPRATTTPTATRQSSPMTKSYQNAQNCRSRAIIGLPPSPRRLASSSGLDAAPQPARRRIPRRHRPRPATRHQTPASERLHLRRPRTCRTR